jgi:hypothetical protein
MDLQTARDHIEDLMIEREELLARLRATETTSDECSPHGIPRPHLKLYEVVDDIPLVFWDLHIYRQSPGYIRVTTFMSADKKKTDHIIETGPTLAGPWHELKRQL